MAVGTGKIDEMPVVKDLKDFNQKSGNLLERLIFNHRLMVVIVCVLVTLLLAYQATKLVFNASFEKMLPAESPLHQELPGEQGGPAGTGQFDPGGGGEHQAATSSIPSTWMCCGRSTTISCSPRGWTAPG